MNLYSQTSVSKLFSNGTVLQRDTPISVWGWGDPATEVSVTLADSLRVTSVDNSGKWKVRFNPMEAGGPFSMLITTDTESISVSDIMIGDVYMISGQSNMEYNLSWSDGGVAEASSANLPNIREFKIQKSTANELSDKLGSGSWKKATNSSNVSTFSAVGYYFAKYLQEEISVPIGLVNSSYGGARIEAFMSDEMLGYDENDITLANGEIERQPTVIFNKMVNPILPFSYKGILWYQAESNGDSMEDALAYGDQFITMITAWRDSINQENLPFIWVQLPNFGQPVGDSPSTWDAWPQLRAQQSKALSLPNTGEAVTIDVGGVDIHPTNKKPVGKRLSLLARNLIYGEDIVANSPRYKINSLTDSGSVIIDFTNKGTGLVSEGLEMISAFALSGDNGQYQWAYAKIVDNKVVVWNDDIPEPVSIRYAWEYNPGTVTLYNSAGLPVAPFQTNVNAGFKIGTFKSARSAIEEGQSTTLNWEVFKASLTTLDGVEVDSLGSKIVSPTSTTLYELIAINNEDSSESDTAYVTIEVLDPEEINRTFNKPVFASTSESCCGELRRPEFAVDENPETRWSSAWSDGEGDNPQELNYDGTPDDEWIMIDLEDYIDINRVILDWEGAFGSSYDIEVSLDGYIWNTVYEERSGDGGEDNITFDSLVTGKYLRMKGIDRGTIYGYSLFEISAFGSVSEIKPPSVQLYSNNGNLVEESTISFSINANATDTDGSIQSVEFFVNGESVSYLTSDPYSITFDLNDSEEYSIYAIATDDNDISIQSSPFVLYTDRGMFTRFEAEGSTTTGQATIGASASTSAGNFLDLQDAWTVTFDPFLLWESGEHLINIRYQLTYESPKTQFLVINGDTVESIEFKAPDNEVWLNHALKVNFDNQFDNIIAIHGFWNWMSIDYIEIEGVNGGLSTDDDSELPTSVQLSQNYPNPFNPSTNISFALPKSDHVQLKVFDLTGRLITTLIDGRKSEGLHSVSFDASSLSSGIYFYQLSSSFGIQSNKMTLIK
tara:strand:+ start:23109 stop:26123 length:3015 start_codon:yes stop_codon:yes gene_type:complete